MELTFLFITSRLVFFLQSMLGKIPRRLSLKFLSEIYRYDKHIRYESRKARADARKRVKGRFVKSTAVDVGDGV